MDAKLKSMTNPTPTATTATGIRVSADNNTTQNNSQTLLMGMDNETHRPIPPSAERPPIALKSPRVVLFISL